MALSERKQLMRAGRMARRFDSVVDVKPAFTNCCAACGEPRKRDATFCAACGHSFEAVRRGAQPFFPARARAEVWRRVAAEAIDRCLPLPLIAWWWPEWTLVVVAYHLLCDATPSGRSPGKAVCRLRAISLATLEPCGVARAVVRRLGVAAAQAPIAGGSSSGWHWRTTRFRCCFCGSRQRDGGWKSTPPGRR